jgi:3-oxoacyl-[acyl-carrier protein] reductase
MSKVALITGASRGIGRAIALRLAARQIKIAISGRDKAALDDVQKKLHEKDTEAITILSDLFQEDSPEKLVNSVVDHFGKLDILINNAGMAILSGFEDTTGEDWDKVMTINAKIPFFICQKALPHLRKSKESTIINISSAVGRLGYPEQAAYGASKHALMGWTKSLAKDVQKDNIRVHIIAPGGVATDMIAQMRPDIKPENLMQPEDIAEIVDFLIQQRGNAMIDQVNVRRFNGTPFQ